MSLYETREQKKWGAVRRAQLGLKHALERIDFAEDVIKPELEALGRGEKVVDSSGDAMTDAKRALPTTDKKGK